MGLDAVELVMAFEEAFEIHIEDDAAAKMLTPRDVSEYVWRRVSHSDAEGCQTQRAFNLLRRTLVQSTGRPRRDIKPSAALNELIPKAERHELRQQFSAILCTEAFPYFVRPRWLVTGLMLLSTGVGLATAIAVSLLVPSMAAGGTTMLAILIAGLTGYASAAATRNLRTEFPPSIASAADLSRWIMCHRRDSAGGDTQRKWTREQVSARVREIVVEHLDCAATYREDGRFIEDLGMS